MNEMVLIALTGFGIAFFHAAIPTHWLPFVITARAQRWNRNKTICVTALAGTGHVLFTAFLGVLIAWFGIALHDKIDAWFPLDRRRRAAALWALLSLSPVERNWLRP